jgi:hypothetical protein
MSQAQQESGDQQAAQQAAQEAAAQQQAAQAAQSAQAAQARGDLTPQALMETLDALPDRIVEALRSASGTSASKETPPAGGASGAGSSGAGTDPQAQHESPGGKFFGYKSAAHWFAGDKS